ncbi:hypothetical protein M0R45_030735 [Rubus argutus]|uniref:Uncharacterized protein n=1 Tax=Rubus argutus TaxID=59490 RepID=A0AAW1WFZ5_RUBAR
MKEKKPISVITDGDEAMRNAISDLIPDVRNLEGGLGRTMRLYDVLPCVDNVIEHLRDWALEDDCKSINSDPVIGSHLRSMQE